MPVTGTWLLPASGRSFLTVGRCDPPPARPPALGRGPLSWFAHEAPRSGGLRAREARPPWRRKSFRQAGGNAQSSLQGFRRDRERARCRGFAVAWFFQKKSFFFWLWVFVGLLSLVWVLCLTRRARLRSALARSLAFFLSVICCCETRRPFEEEWSTVVSVLDWY